MKLLELRLKRGKEHADRLPERYGESALPRPEGTLIWLHAASVGEAQSTLILINTISAKMPDAHFLVTSGTVTSAQLMAERLPENAFHQFYPLDHPDWVNRFLEHWKPDFILWMESELWPNMLMAIKSRLIPTVLVNGRLSDKSFNIWNLFSGTAKELLSTFHLILAQTDIDKKRFEKLGAPKAVTTDNIKFSAAPLPYEREALSILKTTINNRPTWVFASTHEGEELLACRIHSALVQKIPNVMTIIVPRHPERRADIKKTCDIMGIPNILRGNRKMLPEDDTEIYVADTLGELGLFYQLTDIAVIGRSFSDDGGGGHNPIEAAQLNCAILTGPNVQFQKQLFSEMLSVNAAHQMADKSDLLNALRTLFEDDNIRQQAIEKSSAFAAKKTNVINVVMDNLSPLLDELRNRKHSDAA